MDTVIDMYQLRFRMNIQSYPDGPVMHPGSYTSVQHTMDTERRNGK